MERLKKNPNYDDNVLYPPDVRRDFISPEEAQEILFPPGIGPANEDADNETDEDILLPPLMDK